MEGKKGAFFSFYPDEDCNQIQIGPNLNIGIRCYSRAYLSADPEKLTFKISKERGLRDNLITLFTYLKVSGCYHVETKGSSLFLE